MKIVIASDTFPPDVNGAAYFSQRLATLLAKRGHQISVICPGRHLRGQVSWQNGVQVFGVFSLPLLLYPDFRFSPPFMVRSRVREILKNDRPDVVHIQNHFLLSRVVFDVARELGIPVMGTNHMVPDNVAHYLHLSPNAEAKVDGYLWSRFVQIYRQLDFVTAPTVTAARLSERPGLGKEVIPISCGVDLVRFHPGEGGVEIRDRFALRDRLVLLSVGRLDKEKRTEAIIRAMPQIAESVDAHLVVAGRGTLRSSLENLTHRLGVQDRVTFAGFLPDEDLPKLYRAADLFVMPGVAELQSIVTLEAMATGLPVIAADAMALPELVHHDENGFLFPRDDSTALAAAAVTILSSERQRRRMGRNSLEIIRAHDINKTAEAFERLYWQMSTPPASAGEAELKPLTRTAD